jgi:uncharacterized protein
MHSNRVIYKNIDNTTIFFDKQTEIWGSLDKKGHVSKSFLNSLPPVSKERNETTPKQILLVLKLTKDCNLRCKYCYVDAGENHNKDYMTKETARNLLKWIKNNPDKNFSINFHGGEPFLNMPTLQFITENAPSNIVSFMVQTNGTLMQKNIQFIKDNNIGVGISLDGPPVLNDKMRIYANGTGSASKVMQGLKQLKRNRIKYGVICVVGEHNIANPDEVFDFFVSMGARNLKFSPLAQEGRSSNSIDCDEYFEFMKRIYFKLLEHNKRNNRVSVRNFDVKLINLLSRNRPYMCQRNPCGAANCLFGVDTDGKIFACDKLISNDKYICGDLKSSLKDIYSSKPASDIKKRTPKTIKKCDKCIWQSACGQGCTSAAINTFDNIFREDPFCDYYKKIFSFLALQWLDNQRNLKFVLSPRFHSILTKQSTDIEINERF